MDGVPEIPFAGARRLCGARRIGCRCCSSACCRARLPTNTISRRLIQIGMALFMLCSLAWGILFCTDSLRSLARCRDSHRARPGQRLLGPAEPGDPARHRRPRAPAERGAAQRHLALTRPDRRTGLGRGAAARPRPDAWHPAQHRSSTLPLLLFLWKAPYGPKFQKDRPPPRPVRGLADIVMTIESIRGSRIIVSMLLLSALHLADRQQCLSSADAGFRPRSRPWQCRILLWHAARRRCGWRADRRPRAGSDRLAAAARQNVVHARHDLVLRARRLRPDEFVSARRGAAFRRRLRRALLQLDEPDAGAAQRARCRSAAACWASTAWPAWGCAPSAASPSASAAR